MRTTIGKLSGIIVIFLEILLYCAIKTNFGRNDDPTPLAMWLVRDGVGLLKGRALVKDRG